MPPIPPHFEISGGGKQAGHIFQDTCLGGVCGQLLPSGIFRMQSHGKPRRALPLSAHCKKGWLKTLKTTPTHLTFSQELAEVTEVTVRAGPEPQDTRCQAPLSCPAGTQQGDTSVGQCSLGTSPSDQQVSHVAKSPDTRPASPKLRKSQGPSLGFQFTFPTGKPTGFKLLPEQGPSTT